MVGVFLSQQQLHTVNSTPDNYSNRQAKIKHCNYFVIRWPNQVFKTEFFSFRSYFSFSFSFDSNFVLVLLAFHFNFWQSFVLIVLTAL